MGVLGGLVVNEENGADATGCRFSIVAVLGLVAESAVIVVAEKDAREEFSFKKSTK